MILVLVVNVVDIVTIIKLVANKMQPQQAQQVLQPQQVQQPQLLEAAYYGKGIAVYGPTQAWKEDLKTLGGKYNPNLGGQPGWIFGKAREQPLMQFIGSANAGAVQPTPSQVAPRSPYRQQGFGQQQQMPGQYQAPGQQFQAPAIAVPQRQIAPLPAIRPISQGPAQPAQPRLTVTNFQDVGVRGLFPLRFQGDDGLEYQLQWYSVPVPQKGQQILIEYDRFSVPNPPQATYVVSNADRLDPINNFEATVQETGEVINIDLISGEWQIRNAPSHTITLLSNQVVEQAQLDQTPVEQ